MSNVAKKYVKALLKSLKDNELTALSKSLDTLVPAFKDKKFLAIIQSPDVAKKQKEDFLLSMVETKDQKIENFIKLLVVNDRIDAIVPIANELANQIALKNNTFNGVLISGKKVTKEKLKDIEGVLSKKFNATIKLQNIVTGYAGMKVEIESLGVEIGLSTDRLKQQIAETILNAI